MKYLAVAVLGVLALSACNGSSKSDTTASDVVDSIKEAVTPSDSKTDVYTGVLPAADAAGVDYTLTLKYDTDTSGTYDLVQVYQNTDKTTDKTDGTFACERKDNKNYLKLTDSKDTTYVQYYLVDSDTSITLVGADLQPAASDLNYTLTKK